MSVGSFVKWKDAEEVPITKIYGVVISIAGNGTSYYPRSLLNCIEVGWLERYDDGIYRFPERGHAPILECLSPWELEMVGTEETEMNIFLRPVDLPPYTSYKRTVEIAYLFQAFTQSTVLGFSLLFPLFFRESLTKYVK